MMARPRIFVGERIAVHIYLHRDQMDWLRAQDKSASAILRQLIDRERNANGPSEHRADAERPAGVRVDRQLA
jgi:hypothetical protein